MTNLSNLNDCWYSSVSNTLCSNTAAYTSRTYKPIILTLTGTKHTHNRLTALCPGLPGWAGTRKVKPICILLKQETVNSSGISWAICKSAPRSRQITTPAPHQSVFYRPDALPAAQPTASKHWRTRSNQIQSRMASRVYRPVLSTLTKCLSCWCYASTMWTTY